MSYHLTIARPTGDPLTEDGVLRALPAVEGFGGKAKTEAKEGDYIVFTFRLEGHPDLYVYWRNGQLWAERVDDDAHVPILVRIAGSLGAELVGDEGEIYSSEGVSKAPALPRTALSFVRDFLRRNVVTIVILTLFALVAVLLRRYG